MIPKMAEYYSTLYNVELVNLIPHTNWYQCNKNKNLYLISHIVDNVSQINHIIGKTDYIQINFVLENNMIKNIYTETKLSKKRLSQKNVLVILILRNCIFFQKILLYHTK
jgi:hypothetical protein